MSNYLGSRCVSCFKLSQQTNTKPSDVETIVLFTTTPDMTVLSTVCITQAKLGAKRLCHCNPADRKAKKVLLYVLKLDGNFKSF